MIRQGVRPGIRPGFRRGVRPVLALLGLPAAAAGAALMAACDPAPLRESEIVRDPGTIAYIGGPAESERPRIRYADGQESLNDKCVVRKVKLNLRMQPTYVNGRPIGFC